MYDTAFERLLSDEPNQFSGLIAERDGQIVGLTHYLFHRLLWSIEDTCYLMDLYTTPEARGLGVGRALIEAVYAEARAAGIPEVYWHTQEHNSTARALYDTLATKTDFLQYVKNS